jgi:flagellar biosynthesis protein
MEPSDNKQLMAPERRAVAIHYDSRTDIAPTVLATGKGAVAEQILRVARENNVPLRSDPVLAEALSTLDLGDQIPPELYRAVAEILAFIYRLNPPSKLPAAKNTRPMPR